MRRSLAILFAAAFLLLGSLVAAGGVAGTTQIATTTTCSNGSPDTGGLGVICEVTIVNRITATGGSAKVTVRECHGAAGDPTAACDIAVTTLTKPVTKVTQCNDVVNGGGSTVRCSVKITNEFVGISPLTTAATSNQCVGSGDGIANTCDPFPATTGGASVTQCNGSANGGTLVELTCTVTGTNTSSNGVTINQCNGSANGGGALVICSASISNRRVSDDSGGSGSQPTAPATDTLSRTRAPASGSSAAPLLALLVAAIVLVLGGRTRDAFRRHQARRNLAP